MKIWAKFVACFLIAWLPLLGYAAQAPFCPEMAAQVGQTPMHISQAASCAHNPQANTGKQLPACQACLGGVACGMPAMPTTHTTAIVPSSPVYRAIHRVFVEQFIPELPAPPPRSL